MQDSLHGKLGELGLDDILQIIAVSRRTGILTLKGTGREAVLQFKDGLVVSAASTELRRPLGELLVKAGVDAAVVSQALDMQQRHAMPERIGVILRSLFKLDLLQIERIVREQMETVVMSLFPWGQCEYDFVPVQHVDTVDAAYLDPLQLLMEHGDEIEELIAEGLRQTPDMTETAPLLSRETMLVAAQQTGAADTTVLPAAVLADDDEELSRAVARALSGQFTVVSAARTEDALVRIDTLFKEGVRPAIVVDLIMPRMDGSGVLGGLELIQIVRGNFPELPVIAISDFRHDDAMEELAAIGCACLMKPRRGDIQGERFPVFVNELTAFLRSSIQT